MKDLHNAKQLVATSYDQLAERHAEWARHTRIEERERYTEVLLRELFEGAEVLELGCGTGGPTTTKLAERFRLTGVDISGRSVALARRNIPTARFICADMTRLDFPPASFDAVTAFYSIIHVPRQEHAGLLRDITRWLRPGGLFVGTMGTYSTKAGYEEDWLGAPMYWSFFESKTNRRMIEKAGLELLSARDETAEEDGRPITFLWVVAQKPTAETG